MVAWWLYNLKHKELYEWYQQQAEPKCVWWKFISRVSKYGYEKEKALTTESIYKEKRRAKIKRDENGRVCNTCKQYKTRDEFSYNKVWFHERNPSCKVCKNKAHAEYRANWWHLKDQEYKQRRRKLNIWDQVYFNSEIREVIDYRNNRWYWVKSIVSWVERRIDTNDNPISTTHNVVKFTKLTDKIVLEQPKETQQEIEEEKKFSINLDDLMYEECEYE